MTLVYAKETNAEQKTLRQWTLFQVCIKKAWSLNSFPQKCRKVRRLWQNFLTSHLKVPNVFSDIQMWIKGQTSWTISYNRVLKLGALNSYTDYITIHQGARVMKKQKLWHLNLVGTNGNWAVSSILDKKTYFRNDNGCWEYNETFVPNGKII